MKRLLVLSLLLASTANAEVWFNQYKLNFNSNLKVGNYTKAVPGNTQANLVSFPGVLYGFDFEKCSYRVKFESAAPLQEVFLNGTNDPAVPGYASGGAFYYNLEHFEKVGGYNRLAFKTKMGAKVVIDFFEQDKAYKVSIIHPPIKNEINAVTMPGYYKVWSSGLIVQTTCR